MISLSGVIDELILDKVPNFNEVYVLYLTSCSIAGNIDETIQSPTAEASEPSGWRLHVTEPDPVTGLVHTRAIAKTENETGAGLLVTRCSHGSLLRDDVLQVAVFTTIDSSIREEFATATIRIDDDLPMHSESYYAHYADAVYQSGIFLFELYGGSGEPILEIIEDLKTAGRVAVQFSTAQNQTKNLSWENLSGFGTVYESIEAACSKILPEKEPSSTALPDASSTPTLNPFVIGVMESVTGPGELYGTVAVQAKQMAVEEINDAGGINGRMLELVVEDSKCSAQDAITAYNKLTDVDGVKIILGTSCSGVMLGAAPLAEADGVVLFSGLATNPDIAEAGDYIFRTSMSDAQLGIDTGNALWADGIRKLATINGSTDYSEGVRRASVAQFEKRGGEVVAAEQYASDTTDFRSQLTKLLNANPDAIHLAAQGEFSGGTIVKQLRELGYDGPIYSEALPIGSEALEIAGDAATGLKAITADLDPANNKAQEVLGSFRDRYGQVTLPWYLGSAYDDVYITAECLKKTGDDQDADGFRDCLHDINWSGAIGNNYSFDGKGEVVGLSNVVVEVLPTDERTVDNRGYRVLGSAPTPTKTPTLP